MLKRFYVWLFCGSFCWLSSPAQSFRFHHYDLKDGLPGRNIHAMLQDSRGYMWFGTSDGLCRFDGYSFTTYQSNPSDSSSLSFNAVFCLMEDQQGRLWVGTGGGGINVYDWKTERFFTLKHQAGKKGSLSNDYVLDLLQDKEGRIWAATNEGLNVLGQAEPPYTWRTYHRIPGNEQSLLAEEITALETDSAGRLWIGYSKAGLSCLELTNSRFTHFRYQQQGAGILSSNLVKDLLIDSRQQLWVATYRGLSRIRKLPSGEWEHRAFNRQTHGLSSMRLRCLAMDYRGNIWAGSFNGGLMRMANDSLLMSFRHQPGLPQGLASNKISALYQDRQGILWVGVESRGLNKLDLQYHEGLQSAIRPFKRVGSSTQSITAMHADRQGHLWLGTEGDGLDRIQPAGGVPQHWSSRPASQGGISHSIVTHILQDIRSDSLYWISTFGGFNRLQITPEGARIQHFLHEEGNSHSLSDNHIFAAYQDEQSRIWLGTRGGGLNLFDPRSQQFTAFQHEPGNPSSLPNNYVWHILPEGDTGLWLATDGGLVFFDFASQQFRTYSHDPANSHSIGSNFLNVLHKDKRGRLWIGTGGNGLDVMLSHAKGNNGQVSFVHLSERNGLADNFIYGILPDKAGYLWISTNKGLIRLDPQVPLDHPQYGILALQHFTREDGLQDDEFNTNAYTLLSNGLLGFGGINGYNLIDPEQISRNPYPPPVHITHIRILNQEVKPGMMMEKEHIPLTSWEQPQLKLTHREPVVSFEFAALNYLFPDHNQYAYMLEGFDESWVFCGNERKVTYTNLDAGEYVFRVKGSNSDGIWNQQDTALRISVAPPPWKSWWAWTLYLTAGGLLLYAFVHYRIQFRRQEIETRAKIEQAKLEERVLIRKRTAADFHDELGNRMTKIGLFVELARRFMANPQQLGPQLDQIAAHTRSLSEGVRDFIWVLDPDKDALYDSLIRLRDFGHEFFAHSPLQFRFEGIQPAFSHYKLPLEMRRHLLLIFKEGMHNALKYAQAQSVQLSCELQGRQCTITLADNGKGFDYATVSKGYGLSNMQARAGQIGATLQIDSKPGGGTHISLTFEIPNMGD